MDKQKGSFALIKQFMTLQANGIIATHDLLLGTLIDLFPDDIRNYRFEADITDNELTFSCRLIPTTVKVKSNSLTDYAVLHFSRKVDTATASLPV